MFLGSIALAHANTSEHLAFLAGGETVVHLMGKGLGGRNQEIALAAASQIEGIQNVAVFSFGSDGTDGPTDAAGGYVDGKTSRLVDIDAALKASDSYQMCIRDRDNTFDYSKALIQYVLSNPLVDTALLGMRSVAQVEENVAVCLDTAHRIDLAELHKRKVD